MLWKSKSVLYGYRHCPHCKNFKTILDTSNYELERLTKNKKVIIAIKDKLGENIVKEFDLIDDGKEDKKAKAQRRFITKRNVKFKDNIDGLEEDHFK